MNNSQKILIVFLTMLVLLWGGCSAHTRHKIKTGFGQCCCFSVVAIVCGFGLYIWGTNNRIRDAGERRLGMEKAKERDRMIREAPVLLEDLSHAFERWAPQCAHIIREQGFKGTVYEPNSDAWRTHEKSLKMLNYAFDTAKLLHKKDITLKSYENIENIKWLKSLCMNCPAANRGKRNAQCLILTALKDRT